MSPAKAEPYVLGLKLAQKLKDANGIQWSSSGILTHIWGRGFERHHQNAEDASLDMQRALRSQGHNEQADELAAALAEAKRRDWLSVSSGQAAAILILLSRNPAERSAQRITRRPRAEVPSRTTATAQSRRTVSKSTFALPARKVTTGRSSNTSTAILSASHFRVTWIRYHGSKSEQVRSATYRLDKPRRVIRFTLNEGRRTELVPSLPVPAVSDTRSGKQKRLIRTAEILFNSSLQLPAF